jgi:DNA-binding transcriptional LysR family regulator
MNGIELSKLDLNLLVVLQVLLEEQSVTRAGQRLGRTPSALSHALGRLRDTFGDPLLVRAGQGLVPTPAAEALREPLELTLRQVEVLLQRGSFNPARALRSFRLIASDYLQRVALVPALPGLRAEAPGVQLRVLPVPSDLEAELATGRADLALGVSLSAPPGLRARLLARDRFVCLARPEVWAGGADPKAWAVLPHVQVSPSGRPGGPVDEALAALGLRRRVVVCLPHFLAAVELVARTDLILTLPERLARELAGPGLQAHVPPVELAPIEIMGLWHPRVHADPGHRWLRDRLGQLA